MFGHKIHEPVEDGPSQKVKDFIDFLKRQFKGAEIHCPFRSAKNTHCGSSMFTVYRGSIRSGVYYLICGGCGYYFVGPQSHDCGDNC